MAKALKVVGKIAAVVALVAGTVALTIGTGGAFLGVSAAMWGTIATAASIASAVAVTGAQLLTKPPPARGSETRIQIGVEPPSPYLMGEVYSAGVLRHDTAYGATLNKIPNPYRALVIVASVAGPLAACTPQVDFGSVPSYYNGFLYSDTQLGSSPEASALTPHFSGMPNWGASHKLSGQGAILWNALFDKDGKRFATGLPQLGAVWQGVAVYDPRLDSTYPGGVGSNRINDESTWAYSDNPALHAIAYAYGRYQNGKKVFGIGQPVEGIDMARMVAWANVCDANEWRIAGTIYEPGDRWANLKDIMVAGGAEPVVTGGVLSVRYRAPQVSLATVTEDDIADDDFSIGAMQSYRDRINGIAPKYRSAAHNWEFVTGQKVSVPTYVVEDGEEKVEERQWNLVRDVEQVSQLAAYALQDARELGPIQITLKPQWRAFKPGECLTLDLPSLDFNGDAIILSREIDPGTMKVKLTLIGETAAKHPYALGLTGTPPPTPALKQTAEERDIVSSATSGVDGLPGAPGADGQTSYVHFAYASSSDGSVNFTTGAPGARAYIGVLTDFVLADSTTPGDYTWSLIKGADGANGTPGADGADGTPSYVHIAYATNSTGTTGFDLSDSVGKTYIGVYTDSILADSTNPALYTWSLIKGADGADGADGLDGVNGLPGSDGADGLTSYVHFAYANNSTGTVDFTTGAGGSRTYIGVLTDFTVADSTDPALYTWSLIKGADGANGTPGAPGTDGTPSYVHIAYATNATGTTGFDLSDPTGKTYIGVYTDSTPADSTNPALYTWSLIKGADGADGNDGSDGNDGISPVGLTLSPPTVTIQLDSAGVPKVGELPVTFTPKATKDGSPIALTSITINAASGGTWSENDAVITLSAMTAGAKSGEAVFTIVAGGQTLTGNIATFSTAPDGAGTNQVSKSATPSAAQANSASFVQVGVSLAINARPDGTLSVNLTGSIRPNVEGYQFTSKLQYSTNGGSSWTDVSGSQHDSTISVDLSGGEGAPRYSASLSSGAGPYALSGLGASAAVLVRMMIMKKAGAVSTGTTSNALVAFADAG